MKRFLLTLIGLVLFSSLVVAAVPESLLEHGEDLMKAPYPARYKFEKQHGKDWTHSSFTERKIFLKQWHSDIKLQKRIAKREAAQDKREVKERQRLKTRSERVERNAIKAIEKEDRQELLAQHRQQRHFKSKVNRMEGELKSRGNRSRD